MALITFFNKVVAGLVGAVALLGSSSVAYAVETAATVTLTKVEIPTGVLIANITFVGVAMIGVALAIFGIRVAKRMIS